MIRMFECEARCYMALLRPGLVLASLAVGVEGFGFRLGLRVLGLGFRV